MVPIRRLAVASLFGVGFLAVVAMQELVAGDCAVRRAQEPIQVTHVGDNPADSNSARYGGTVPGPASVPRP